MRKYFIFACIMVTVVTCISLCIRHFRGAGNDSMTDIREVAADPETYAGQTLTSRATMMDWNRFAGDDGRYLALGICPDLRRQAESIYEIHGKRQEVRITYRLYDWNTFATIKECWEAQERVRGRARGKISLEISLEKEQVRLEKPMREFAAIEKQALEVTATLQQLTQEREQLTKELIQFQANEKDRLERISKIEIRLQELPEEKKKLKKKREELLASEGENKLQRASEIEAKLQGLIEENKELTREKDELQPKIKIEAELLKLANEQTRLQYLVKKKKEQEPLNREKARLCEELARSSGLAASQVIVVLPITPYPRISRRTRHTRGPGGPTESEWRQEERAREERKRYAAQKKRRNRLLAQEKKQRQAALRATARAGRLAKEQRDIQQRIKDNVKLQRTTIEKLRLLQVTKEKQELQWTAKENQQLQQLAKAETNLERLNKQKERIQLLVAANTSKLTAIAEEIGKIEEAEKSEREIALPLDFDGIPVKDLDSSGILLAIDVPRYR